VAHTVITTIAQEGLLERVRENGLLLLGLLQALAATRPRAQTARGVGLMAALELSPGVDGESVRDCAGRRASSLTTMSVATA
jgi:acetylornithine/succinyldiaminopimelate/putrescine aminotransferase